MFYSKLRIPLWKPFNCDCSTLLEANELSTRQNELARAKTAPKEDAVPMEIDEKNENSDDETSEPLINLKPKEEEVTRASRFDRAQYH